MGFIARQSVAEPIETWPGMESAAQERYWDGLALAVSEAERTTGAIYLLGYVAEMLVKTAYFRFSGVLASDDLSLSLRAARQHSQWTGGNLHNLQSWVNLLIQIRRLRNNPIDPITAGQIHFHVLRVKDHWSENIRYRHLQAEQDELNEVLESVDWLLVNSSSLWS